MGKQGAERHGGASVRRWALEASLLLAIGLLLGFLGPFGSDRIPATDRYVYWVICIVGGGLIGIAADEVLRRQLAGPWRRTLAVSLVAAPAVTVHVLVTEHMVTGHLWAGSSFDLFSWWYRLWQVVPILLAIMIVRTLVWHRPPVRVETRTVVAPPLPEAEAAFRRRLSARRRTARLIAVEAHDHYLKVHTDAGEEMITLRFSDALDELAKAHGWRVHRSWWVAADAVQDASWKRGVGELRLTGGLVVPVSRTHAAILKNAGWF